MTKERDVQVHLLPELVPAGRLAGATAVVIDVLRATTTMVFALAAGCRAVFPCLEINEAKELADRMPPGSVLLAGERGGKPIPGFDLGNSPGEFLHELCRDKTLVMTTTNGTRALVRAAEADRILIGAFVNFSAVCEHLHSETRPIHILCAGSAGEITLEDTLLAGAFVNYLHGHFPVNLNDSARLAGDCYDNHGGNLQEALGISQGGILLQELGYEDDVCAAAKWNRYSLVPAIRRDPFRVEAGVI